MVDTKQKYTVRLIVIALLVLLAAGAIILFRPAKNTWYSPADKPRPWAQDRYAKIIEGAGAGTISPPTLTTNPTPKVKRDPSSSNIKYTYASDSYTRDQEFEQHFVADVNNVATLPSGNRLKLKAIALARTTGTRWQGKPKPQLVELNWLDPVTLQPLPPENTSGWDESMYLPVGVDILFMVISNDGKQPVCWGGATVFDERTKILLSNSCSYVRHSPYGKPSPRVRVQHQTPIRIAVHIAFGKPRYQTLSLKSGQEARFSDQALCRVLSIEQNYLYESGSKSYSPCYVSFMPVYEEKNYKSAIMQIWPMHNGNLLDAEITDRNQKTSYTSFYGSYGICCLNVDQSIQTVRIRRLPHLGRVIFRIPKLPDLPEVDNLFDTPLPYVNCRTNGELNNQIEYVAGAQLYDFHDPPYSAFPITLADTTPKGLLDKTSQLTGDKYYFDSDKFTISTTKPKTRWQKLVDWAKRTWPF